LSVIAAGGHVVIPSPYALRRPEVVQNYWQIVERYQATIVSGVPTSIASLSEVPVEGFDLSSVRMGLTGGAVLPRAVGERFESRTGILLYETYGMTETAAAIAFNPGRGERVPGSVGFRAPYAETMIAKRDDGERWSPCPPQVSGSVLVRGPQVFPGYTDPAHNLGVLGADGWLVTGDIGFLTEDQRLVLTGREKDLIIRGGHNIDPAAIEDVANGFPGVQISAAVGMPDAYAGEAPILFAVPAPGRTVDVDALKTYLAERVLEPPARPKRVALLDALPVTAVGKIFKPALRDLAVRENSLLEIERIFGPDVEATVEVGKDDQLRTVVTIAVGSADPALREQLVIALSKLPQRYLLLPAEEAAAIAARR
jgi:fatty-acyl-CoA synthase